MDVDDEVDDFKSERTKQLGFVPQKEIVYNHYLPYKDDLVIESLDYLAKIKANISRTILLNDPHGFMWVHDLSKYIQLYGHLFSKEDHIYFVKVLCQIILIPDLELNRVASYANVISTLLSKHELLSPDELEIPWRPFYKLYESTLHSKYEYLGMLILPDNYEVSLKGMIKQIRNYFPKEATQEMLDEWRPLLCPYDQTMEKASAYFELFLPTTLPPEKHEFGFKLWFDEFMTIWYSTQTNPTWERNFIALFSRLATDTIGYINWEPFIAKIFTHLMRGFNLVGGQHKLPIVFGRTGIDINSFVVWIVSMLGPQSSCQQHLTRLFKAIDSYYHPSNTGAWNMKLLPLLSKLPMSFTLRLHRERYKKKSWKTPIPDSHKLTEKDINEFVNSLKDVVMLAMFGKLGFMETSAALQHLSSLRPEIVIPPVIDKLYSALETLTEPHRLTATMSSVVSMARTLVHGGKFYPEGPTHVIPLLMSSLNGLDVNDMKKCMVTFQFISTFVTLVPIIDCSGAVDVRNDLSETEVQVCLATAEFEDFVLQFMDRCFVLIENSQLEQVNRLDNRNSDDRLNSEEGIIEVGLASTFGSILLQCSPAIFNSALDKLHSFVTSHIFETKVAGRFAAILIRSCSKANAELSLQKFLPYFSKLVMTLSESEEVLRSDEILDNELLFSLLLVSEVVRSNGVQLLKYKDLIIHLLDRILYLACRKCYTLGSTMLKHVLKALTQVYALDFKSISKPWDAYDDFEKELPIRDWGCAGELHTLNIEWHVPNQQELLFAQQLLDRFLKFELNSLDSWAHQGQVQGKTLSREELQRSLHVILECVIGTASALPHWQGEYVPLFDTLVPLNTKRVHSTGSIVVNFSDESNIREKIIQTLRRVLNHILNTCEDDTKSLCLLIRIYHNILIFWGITKQEFNARWKGFHVVKKALENKLMKKKRNIRALIVDRFMLQHEIRLMNKPLTGFTELHRDIMFDLMNLSTSHYSQVRARAQEAINACFQYFPYSYRVILPIVLKNLNKQETVIHEQFKGTLFTLIGQKKKSLLTVRDWGTLKELWPALVNAPPSEKQSIINLIDNNIINHVKKYSGTITLGTDITNECVELAKSVWNQNKSVPLPSVPCPSDDEIRNSIEKAKQRNQKNINHYNDLIERIVYLVEQGDLHWRYKQLAFVLLSLLIRYDIKYPKNAVNLFTKSLIHDTLYIRKIVISSYGAILKQLKPHHGKYVLENYPNDNLWLHYDPNFKWDDSNVWSSTIFIDKPQIGFYNFSKPLLIYDKNQPKLERLPDQLNESEQVIYSYFSDQTFIDQLFNYLSLEENKGKDKFSSKRFHLWKGLFRNFGNLFSDKILEKVNLYVNGKDESAHRCSAELIAGILRGSKHWSHNNIIDLKNKLEPIIRQVYGNITNDTLYDWGTCSATIFENRDPRRFVWILNVYFDDPLKDGGNSLSAFLQASRLYILLGAVNQMEWKGQKVLKQMLVYLEEKHLTHSYQNVRDRIASVMCNIFAYDVLVPCLPKTLGAAPKRADFIDKILPRLNLFQEDVEETKNQTNGLIVSQEKKDAINLIKTLCRWIIGVVGRISYSCPPELFKLLPTLCVCQSETNDEELVRETLIGIFMLSQSFLLPQSIEAAIQTAKQISKIPNWHARNALAKFIHNLISSNMFTLTSNKLWVEQITELILQLLTDERVEVRESSADTLSGILHCGFIKIDDKLINTFKLKANHKLVKIKQANGLIIADPNDVTTKHGGILGLCACVNAYPYDVPQFMPDILMFMSYHLNDPQPIPATIKKTLANFRRTHLDSWRDHKLKFTDDQLAVITDLLVSPSYYA